MTDKMTSQPTYDEIEALLPFYVNGTLEGEERTAVEAAIEARPDLAQQAEALGHIRAQMQAEELEFSPGDMGFARLSQAIAAPSLANSRFAPTWWRTGGIAACAALIAFGAALQVPRSTETTQVSGQVSEQLYELASAAQDAPRLQIAFLPQTSMEEVSDMLNALNLSIVAGPSALGFYELAGPDEAALQEALTVLETRTELVEHVDILQ